MTFIKKPAPRPSAGAPNPLDKKAAPAPKLAAKGLLSFKKDELSTGRGGALRRDAAKLLSGNALALPRSVTGAPALPGGASIDPAVAAAANNVNAAYNSSTDPQKRSEAVAKAISENGKAFEGNPALAAQYAAAIAPTVSKLATELGANKDSKWVKGVLKSLGETATKLGGEATLALGRAVAKGLPNTDDLYFIDDALGSTLGLAVLAGLSEQGKATAAADLADRLAPQLVLLLSQRLGEGLFALQAIPPEVLDAAALALQKLGRTELAGVLGGLAVVGLADEVSAAQSANDTMAQLTAELNNQLVHVPDALKNAYQQEYWARHSEEQQKADAANAALKTALDAQLPTLQALAASNPKIAEALAGALGELARDPAQAQYVSDTIDRLAVGGAFPPGFEKAEKKLVEARSMAAQSLAQGYLARGDSKGASDVLQGTLDFLGGVKFASQEVLEIVAEQLPALRAFTATVTDAVRTGNFGLIKDYLLDKENAEALAGIVKSNPALGNLIAGTGLALFVLNAATATDGTAQVLAILEAGGAAADLLSSGVNTLGKLTSSKALVNLGKDLAKVSEVIGKVAGAIGVVLSALETFKAFGGVLDEPSLKNVTNAVVSTLTTVGGAIALFPGGQVLGPVLLTVALAVTLFTSLFEESPFEKTVGEIDDILNTVFAKEATNPNSPFAKLSVEERKKLAHDIANSPVQIDQLMREGGLSVAQFIDLALHTPILTTVVDDTITGEVFHALGLKGQKLVDWLKELSPDIASAIDNAAYFGEARDKAETARIEAHDKAKKAGKSDAEADAAGEAARVKKLDEELKKSILETLNHLDELESISDKYKAPNFGL